MKQIQSKSYLSKKAQFTPDAGLPEDDFQEQPEPRRDKEYFASIGVRIKVVSGNPQQEQQLAQQAFEAIKEQIQSGVNEDMYEAWLSGHDEPPQTMGQMSGGIMG